MSETTGILALFKADSAMLGVSAQKSDKVRVRRFELAAEVECDSLKEKCQLFDFNEQRP
jgi:hypothetical protein